VIAKTKTPHYRKNILILLALDT